jgi:hypothetical protein
MIIGIRNWQDTGKTALAVGTIIELLMFHGYEPDEVIANIMLKIPGTHSVNNAQMKQYIKAMIARGLKHKVILVDEADRVFPARFWQDRAQTEALLGLWQDVKCFHNVIYTAHTGTSVDINLRNTTQVELEPKYEAKKDRIPFRIYNALKGIVYDDCVENVSKRIFPFYDRWEIVGKNDNSRAERTPEEAAVSGS